MASTNLWFRSSFHFEGLVNTFGTAGHLSTLKCPFHLEEWENEPAHGLC